MINGESSGSDKHAGAQRCQHERLHFGSGAYYVFCSDCHRKWVAWKAGAAEYGPGFDGADTSAGGDLVGGADIYRFSKASLSAERGLVPVAWRYRYHHGAESEHKGVWKYADTEDECNQSAYYEREALYAAPSSASSSEGEIRRIERETLAEAKAELALADKLEGLQDDGSEGMPWSQEELDLIIGALRGTPESHASSNDARDAARYRWLRSSKWYVQVMSDLMDRFPKFCVIGTELDGAIDAEMNTPIAASATTTSEGGKHG